MVKKLYVGNLPYSIKDKDLEELFKSVGEVVSAKVICDYDSQRSKGFGFVEMTTEDDAAKALSEMNGKDVDGRTLKVSEAKPKTENRR
jgi:cold-inducible RNA-binding protein